ncbi:MAG: FKBP-type peptidyl-prolyl cis-trans isomerase [Prevotellaceae bacterium]|jgi:FKBP-type peptidyl-prolyl cis-trans isomerase FklB|nr:FKBP-type peptidyl-prolyl cis-trans isomerase [Prevotellaceae bacterium]
MKKILFISLLAALFTSCKEVEEPGKYDNWQARNQAYADSLQREAGNNFVATEQQALNMSTNTLFAIQDMSVSTDVAKRYVYCKKISENNPSGIRPLYTSTVTLFYYGTFFTGEKFDGNFTGYSAAEHGTLDPQEKEKAPTPFDSPNTWALTSLRPGMVAAMQYMRSGERWILYLPFESGYGSTEYGSIPAYSALVFDVQIEEVIP